MERELHVRIRASTKTIEFLEKLLQLDDLENDPRTTFEICKSTKSFTAQELKQFSSLLKQYDLVNETDDVKLSNLLAGTEGVILPKPIQLSSNPEVTERRKMLIARQEQREYARMCADVSPFGATLSTNRNKFSDTRGSTLRQAAVGLNLLLAALVMFFFTYYCLGSTNLSNEKRAFISVIVFVFTLLAEMILFIIRATRSEENQRKSVQFASQKLFPGRQASNFSSPLPTAKSD